jgi:hypothetical protein
MRGHGEPGMRQRTESSSCFQVLLKPVLTHGRGETWVILDHQKSLSGEDFGWSLG